VTEDIIRTAYRANKVFISCTGLSFINGITDGSERETDVKIAMIDVSEEVILVCDQSKFGKISFPKIADISRINCFITDADESNSLIKKIKKAYPAIKIYSIFGKADI
jgi:DeoR/GlpR family transcriptional regulator of sugar metabolism